MKIVRVEIDNFRTFSQFTGRGFKAMNMIYGHNNTGKSNFLQFLAFLFSPKSEVEVRSERESALVAERPFWEGLSEGWPHAFREYALGAKMQYKVGLDLDGQARDRLNDALPGNYRSGRGHAPHLDIAGQVIARGREAAEFVLERVELNRQPIYELRGEEPVYFPGGGEEVEGMGFALFSSVMNEATKGVSMLPTNRSLTLESYESDPAIILSPQTMKSWLHRLYLSPETYSDFDELQGFLSEALPEQKKGWASSSEKNLPRRPWNLGFGRYGDTIELMIEDSTGSRKPISSFGTGVQQIIMLFVMIFAHRARVYLIEELELNLSPNLQARVLRGLAGLISRGHIDQVFFTTHSRYFDYRSDFQVFEMDLDSQLKSSLTRQTNPSQPFFTKRLLE